MVSIRIGFPGISIGLENITLSAWWKKKTDPAGPFLIIGRACGLALDTAWRNQQGDEPHLWAPHAERQQLWLLRPSGVKGEVLIVSADNGLALDSTRDTQKPNLLMCEPSTEAHQRWRLKKSPDGAAFEVEAAHNQRLLTAAADFKPTWKPWFDDRRSIRAQQWIFALPHGGAPTTG
jgi:hypothetical protein